MRSSVWMGLGLAGLATSALAANAGQLLTGKAAFGDWRQDAPGVVRHITADDLDPPGATPSASNAPSPVPMLAGALPKVPEGFKVELVATGMDNPRAIRFAPNGDLFIANSEKNEVLVLRPGAGAKPQVFAEGLNQPYGIAFYPPGPTPQWVYIANGDGIVRIPYKAGDLEAEGKPQTVVDKLPTGGHWTRDVAFSPDGKTMYVAVGSNSNIAEGMGKQPAGGLDAWITGQPLGAAWGSEQGRANVLAFDPEGKNRAIFATGLRNCAGLAVEPATGAPWCVVNERDALGDNVPFDYATHLSQGAYFGWPWYYIGNHEDPRLRGARPDLAGKATVPDVLFQTHSAPLNIVFYESDAFGPDYKGDAFVTMHGSWNRGARTGYKVVLLKFKDGRATGEYQDFMTGFVLSNEEVWGRPVGVAAAGDGSLYVSDDGSGSIWRVSKQ
jgi:glucose/arabinose dehydrogenase